MTVDKTIVSRNSNNKFSTIPKSEVRPRNLLPLNFIEADERFQS